jgi:L-lactate dehydrogenase complex protein LldG
VSREAVLRGLREALRGVPVPELPAIAGVGEAGALDLRTRFAEEVAAAGGRVVPVESAASLGDALASRPEIRRAGTRASLVPDAGLPSLEPGCRVESRALAALEFALVPGELGVAENGAVFVREPEGVSRAVLFLPEHVGLVLRARDLVPDLHAAYARLAGTLGRRGFGGFVCGPSKTADIEQALVIGAHGPRALSVFLLAT